METKLSSPIALIKQSFAIFYKKENLIYFLKIYAPLVPFALIFIAQDSFLKISTQNLNISDVSLLFTKYGWLSAVIIIVNLAYLIISFWISAAGIKAVSGITEGIPLPIKETFQFAWKKLWIFSLLSIVLGLVVGLGFIFLIMPGVIFMVWYHFSGYELLTKEIGVKEAMRNSKNLVKGRFWKVFGRILVFGVFQILVQILFGIIPLSIGSVLMPLAGALLILPYFLLYRELNAQSVALQEEWRS